MKNFVKWTIRIVFFPFIVLSIPLSALGYWLADKDITYPQAIKRMWRFEFK